MSDKYENTDNQRQIVLQIELLIICAIIEKKQLMNCICFRTKGI
jgi:hypothetical protein